EKDKKKSISQVNVNSKNLSSGSKTSSLSSTSKVSLNSKKTTLNQQSKISTLNNQSKIKSNKNIVTPSKTNSSKKTPILPSNTKNLPKSSKLATPRTSLSNVTFFLKKISTYIYKQYIY